MAEMVGTAWKALEPYVSKANEVFYASDFVKWWGTVDYATDIAVRCLIFCCVRFFTIGVFMKSIRKMPCLLDFLFPKFLINRRKDGNPLAENRKVFENIWYAVWHTSSVAWVYSVIGSEPWFEEVLRGPLAEGKSMASQATLFFGGGAASEAVKNVYLWQQAFWISCAVFICVEVKRKDFYQMLGHHVVTVFALLQSWQYHYWRFGLMVLLIHDVGDVFLYIAKTCTKCKIPSIITDSIFGLFVIGFLFGRLFVFPYCVIVPATPYLWFSEEFKNSKTGQDPLGFISTRASHGCLCVLQVLHCIWGWMIVKVIHKIIFKGEEVHDTRSDDEECMSPVSKETPPNLNEEMKKMK